MATEVKQPQRVLQLFLPSSYQSWADFPANPFIGTPVVPSKVQRQPPAAPPATVPTAAHHAAETANPVQTVVVDSKAAVPQAVSSKQAAEPHSPATPKKKHIQPAAPAPREIVRYCDPCQKEFYTVDKYEEHMKDHIYCTVEGCGFTCRKGKEWKMDIHMDTLHNRPDAPQLHDVGGYLEQRKSKFPTTEKIQAKVEEIYYQAARGEVLPEERRRWMQRHGIVIRKRGRDDPASYIVEGAPVAPSKEDHGAVGASSSGSGSSDSEDVYAGDGASAALKNAVRDAHRKPAGQKKPTPVESTDAVQKAVETTEKTENKESTLVASDAASVKQPRIESEGPGGRLSRQQQLQLAREKFQGSRAVPKFYVCNRCGIKGQHWVADCPTIGNPRFDTHAAKCPPAQAQQQQCAAAKPQQTPSVPRGVDPSTEPAAGAVVDSSTSLETVEEMDARVPKAGFSQSLEDECANAKMPFISTIQPAAAARMKGKGGRMARGNGPQHRPQATLFEQLTRDASVDEKGLLLQAMKFFVTRNFFQDSDAE